MHVERFRIGDIDCLRLVHGRGRGTPVWMFPDVPPDQRAARMGPFLDAAGTFEYVYSSLLLRVGRAIVLVDTGPPPEAGGDRPSIERFLDGVGVRPSDVRLVVISHGHLDHIGGLVRSGEPVFARARHVVDLRELRHWTSGAEAAGGAAALLGPAVGAGLVDTVDGDHEVLPGVTVVPTPGHTPGHLAVAVASGGETMLYAGDVLAHEVNVAEPGWNHFSDLLAAPAVDSRRSLVERAARVGALVVGSHLSTRGRVRPTASGRPGYEAERPGVGSAAVTGGRRPRSRPGARA